MSGRRDSGREAVSWLATGVVSSLGVVFCGSTILAFAKQPGKPMLVLCGVFLGLAILLYLLREKPKESFVDEESKWFGLFRKPKMFTQYKPKRHRKLRIVQFGTNEPPTAEGIREIKEANDGMKNWAPPETDPHHDPRS